MAKIRYRTYIDRDFGTIATMDKKTGKLTGRKKVRGFGDKTAVIRASSPRWSKGRILGRTPPIVVRGSSKSRATTRVVRRTL